MKRSKWKGPFIKPQIITTEKLPSLPRNFTITLHTVGSTFKVHSGKKLMKLSISAEMIGHKVGEFIPTREKFEFKKKKKKK